MAIVFKIGEHSDFPPVPYNFPQCGNWSPDDTTTPTTTTTTTTEKILETTHQINTTTIDCNTTQYSIIKKLLLDLHIETNCDTTSSGEQTSLSIATTLVCLTLTGLFIY